MSSVSLTVEQPPAAGRVSIVGASARAAAASAERAGLTPWAADIFGDLDLQACCPSVRVTQYPWALAEALSHAPAGPWMYTGGLENYPDLLAELAKLRPLWGNPAGVVQRVRDPWLVAAALGRHRLACPACAAETVDLPADGSWLIKGRRSAGGTQVAAWRGQAQPEQADVYYQQRLAGQPAAAVFVAAAGRAVFVGATEQLLSCDETQSGEAFRYAGSLGPLALTARLRSSIEQLGQALAAEFALTGLFGVDLVLADDVAWPVEVNPRYTASMELLERAWRLPLIAWHGAACEQAQLPADWPAGGPVAPKAWSKQILFARHELTLSQQFLQHVSNAREDHGWPAYADLSPAGTTVAVGWPIVTAFAAAGDLPAARQALRERVAATERWLYA